MRSSKNYAPYIILVPIVVLCILLFNQYAVEYYSTDPKLAELHSLVIQLCSNGTGRGKHGIILNELHHKYIVNKEISLYWGKSSYTVNKKNVYMCLYNKDGKYYNNNVLIYVLLHELAHCLCDEVGHTQRFKYIFNILLEEATRVGIYDSSQSMDMEYCKF